MANERDTTTLDRGPDPAQPAMLLVVGNGRMSTHVLGKGLLVIGRSADCDISVAHPALSRRHAALRLGPPITVQDLGSMNGTRIAGEVHLGGDEVALGAREGFSIGPFTFVLLSERGPRSDADRPGADPLRIEDPTLEGVPAIVRDIAASTANILVLGETGVGKELLAETVHVLSGRRGSFLRLNCATLSDALLESELFGHEKGAFTGAGAAKPGLLEAARAGTVFLDEIGDLPVALQPRLLRAVESGEVMRVGAVAPIAIDVRFVAATNRDLMADIASGRFRADLYYRLDGVSLRVPPLRERRSMIVPLALRFLAGKGAAATPEFLARLEAHDWPGNVRELKAVVERAVLLARGEALDRRHLVFATPSPAEPANPPEVPVVLTRDEIADRDRIVEALEACAGNQTRAAKHLGVARATLAAKLARYRIPRPRAR